MKTLYDEFYSVTKFQVEPGEDFLSFAKRLTDKVNIVDDAVWDSLSKAAQDWHNETVTAFNERRALKKEGLLEEAEEVELPVLPGFVLKELMPAPKLKVKPPRAAPKLGTAPQRPAKAVKALKVKVNKPKAKKAKGVRGRPRGYNLDGTIKILVRDNPHRKGGLRDKSFRLLKSGMTPRQAIEAGCDPRQIWSMIVRNLISVTDGEN